MPRIEKLASGEASVAVGTHALLTEGVDFDRLGLAIIDEQHRFGVEQRARLRAKGVSPHTLHMTATPIPRTLAQIGLCRSRRFRSSTSCRRAERRSKPSQFERAGSGASTISCARSSRDGPSSLRRYAGDRGRRRDACERRWRSGAAEERGLSGPAARIAARPARLAGERGDHEAFRAAASSTCSSRRRSLKSASTFPTRRRWSCSTRSATGSRNSISLRGPRRPRSGEVALRSGLSRRCWRPRASRNLDRDRPTDSGSPTKICGLRGPGQLSGTLQSGAAETRLGDLLRDFDVYRAAKAAAEKIVALDPSLGRARARRPARDARKPAADPRVGDVVMRIGLPHS